MHHASRAGSVGRRHSISLVAAGGCWISLIHLGHQSLWRRHVAGGAQTLQANSGKIAAMARPQTARSTRRARDELTVSYRERLVEELLADPKLAAEYLLAATEDSDHRVYFTAGWAAAGPPGFSPNQLLLVRNLSSATHAAGNTRGARVSSQ